MASLLNVPFPDRSAGFSPPNLRRYRPREDERNREQKRRRGQLARTGPSHAGGGGHFTRTFDASKGLLPVPHIIRARRSTRTALRARTFSSTSENVILT
jgi:hypothetical protein